MKEEKAVTTSLDCDECGSPMIGEWEDIMGDNIYSVFHCEHCGEDRQVVRKYTKDGRLLSREVKRFFFG